MRKEEYFKRYKAEENESVSMTPPVLYEQKRDWTCSLACIRSMLSAIDENVPEEDDFIEKYQMTPGPYYSKELKNLGILTGYDAKYGCDFENVSFDEIIRLMKEGYYVMLESMVNYAHWMVLLGYYAVGEEKDFEKYKLLFFDPYYNRVRLMNADEFLNMWIDGDYANTGVKTDFVAVRK